MVRRECRRGRPAITTGGLWPWALAKRRGLRSVPTTGAGPVRKLRQRARAADRHVQHPPARRRRVLVMSDELPLSERMVADIYSRVVRAGDTVVDCGAHTGRHTLPLAQLVSP